MSNRLPVNPRALRGATALVIALSAVVMGGAPAQIVLAGSTQQAGNSACTYNGKLIVPAVDAAHAYGWGFVANFDHAPSSKAVTTCLAERFFGQQPWQTKYTIAEHCAITNNSAAVSFGNGVAMFDGKATLSCVLPVPQTFPDLFWIKANVSLPNASQAYTFLDSTAASFTGQTGAGCELRLTSRYSSFTYSHNALAGCGSFIEAGTKLERTSATTQSGMHKIGATLLGPVTNNGQLIVPANYAFTIGAAGQPFTLDWLVIDPTPSRCCSPN